MSLVFDKPLPAALAEADNLPSLPGVAVSLLELSQSEDAGLEDYATVISMDPALSVRILKLANSSLYNLGQEITTLERAMMVLGTKTVQLMSLSFSLVEQMPTKGSNDDFNYQEYWKRSLSAAVAGRELGRLLEFTLADEAFLCGLLSRLGQLVLSECMPDEYSEVIGETRELPTRAQEDAGLGFNHGDIGASLLKSWGLPESLYLSVAYLNNPEELPADPTGETARLCRIVHIASLIVGVLYDTKKGSVLGELHTAAQAAGLSTEQTHTLILALESRIEETALLLEIEVGEKLSHYAILDGARKQLVALSVETVREFQVIERRSSTNENNYRELKSAKNTDKLTGMGDRSFLDACLNHEISLRLKADGGEELGLILVEIADFKAIDKNLSEQVINVVGQTLRGISRATDAPARYSNHVFAIFVPSGNSEAMTSLAGRIIKTVQAMPVVAGQESIAVQINIGVGIFKNVAAFGDADKLIAMAEAALAISKQTGPGATKLQSN